MYKLYFDVYFLETQLTMIGKRDKQKENWKIHYDEIERKSWKIYNK